MDKKVLFAYLRRAPFGGRLTQGQVDGVNLLLKTFEDYYPNADARWVANCIAQVFHETGGRMQPVRETYAPSDRSAIGRLENAWKKGQLKWVKTPYWQDGWFGRGHIQITHKVNYARLGNKLGLDLVGHPSLALNPKVSARIAVVGMMEGLFVPGHNLGVYFNDEVDDPEGARRIVNGTDKAKLIAQYHAQVYSALEKAATTTYDDLPESHLDHHSVDPVVPRVSEEWGQGTSLIAFLLSLIGVGASDASDTRLLFLVCLVVALGVFGRLWLRKRQ